MTRDYRFADPKAAHVFVGVQVSDAAQIKHLVGELKRHDYPVLDMTDNEMAKLHIRHLVGGRAPAAEHEILYRFMFPERPGALMNFLNKMGGNWNISLFHYRNHGSDYGRVLAGIQVPRAEHAEFLDHLDDLHYNYVEETQNPAYRMFLGRETPLRRGVTQS